MKNLAFRHVDFVKKQAKLYGVFLLAYRAKTLYVLSLAMTFSVTPTLVNNDSKIRIDVESAARVVLSDIDYILDTMNDIGDVRHQTFLLESAITKVASVFQLAIRACDYLENQDFKHSIIKKAKKGAGSHLGTIGALRDESFHNGYGVLKSERYYPFAQIKGQGRGYVGIYVYRGASLKIAGYHTFHSSSCEYAITSEGIYQINDVGTPDETWVLMDTLFNVTALDIKSVLEAISEALSDLKLIWKELRDIRTNGDGTHEYSYLNEGGAIEFLEKGKDQLTSYKMGGSLRIRGALTITPPDGMKIEQGRLTYFVQNGHAQQGDQPDA